MNVPCSRQLVLFGGLKITFREMYQIICTVFAASSKLDLRLSKLASIVEGFLLSIIFSENVHCIKLSTRLWIRDELESGNHLKISSANFGFGDTFGHINSSAIQCLLAIDDIVKCRQKLHVMSFIFQGIMSSLLLRK